ncbi:MAG: carboxypeptidase regulatory-like domain-containing protein [Planctomycetota bacterium]|nr:carboxypeptidase regulatory-like domain-containing protein [Planctomycetota bacterium]
MGVTRIGQGNGWSEYAVRFDPLGSTGEYQLTVMPTVQDEEGGFLDQDLDNTPGELDDDRYVAAWSLTGPRVESHEPSGALLAFTPLAHFDIVFSAAMDQGSFSLGDIKALTGPDGAILPTGYEWRDDRTLRVKYEPVFEPGTVSITIGTDVYDQWGNALDQNQNAVAGEAGDTWTGSVTRTSATTIDQDTVIPSNAGTVVLDSTVTVAVGATLTIEPGVTLQFGSGAGLTVNGKLIVLGTVDRPVVFTSSAASPGSNAWTGIKVTGTGSINLNHAEVRHAAKAVDANSNGARAVLNNTTLRDGEFGVYVYSPFAEVTAENLLVVNNAKTGIFVRADSRHTFKNCTIVGNGFGGSGWYGAGIHLGGAAITLENCIVAFNNTGLNHSGDPPTVTVRNSIFYNPAGQEIVWDGDPGMPDLAADGNMTVDPLFVDGDNGNYELAASSPAIDAGTGIHAPAADLLGRSRYDDQGMLNVGNGYPSFVDIGVYERQDDSPVADLMVSYVSDPTPEFVNVGDSFNLEWTVSNIGVVEVTGSWQDLVYLSDDPYLGGDELLATVDHTGPLAAGASYTETLTANVPATSGPKYILVHTQLDGIAQQEAVETNNLGVSAHVVAVDVPLLEVGAPLATTASQEQWRYYRFEGQPGRTVLFSLDGEAGNAELFLRQTLPPTLSDYDVAGNVPNLPDQELRLLDPVAGTYYVGVFTRSLGGGSGSYTLSADLTTLGIREVAPNEAGNTGSATIEILGDSFSADAQVQLIAPDGAIVEGNVFRQDSSTLFATFDLAAAGAAPGLYDVVVINPSTESVTAYDAVSVVDGGVPAFSANLSMPGVTRPGRVIDVRIDYTNTSTVDVFSPVLTLDSGVADTEWSLPWRDEWIVGSDFRVMGLSSQGPPTILRPGQTETIVVQLRVPFRPERVTVSLSSVGAVPTDGSNEPIDWAKFEAEVRPEGIDDGTWDLAFAELQNQTGNTWGEYAATLRENVERWNAAGRQVYSVRELFGMELDEAYGFPTGILAGRLKDADSGLPIGNVKVEAWGVAPGSYATAVAHEAGSFFLYGLTPGQLELAVSEHLVSESQSFELPTGEDLLDVEVLATEAGHLAGAIVTDVGAQPIEGATLWAFSSTGEFVGAASTDKYGSYRFGELPADTYVIKFSAEGYATTTIDEVEVALGSTTVVDLALADAGMISGTVVLAAEGIAAQGAEILARGQTTNHVAIGHTNSEGIYELSELPTDEYTVTVSLPGYVPVEAQAISVTAGLDFALQLGATIEGVVVGPGGIALEGARVVYTSATYLSPVTYSDAEGRFTMAGLPGTDYELWAFSAGLAQQSSVAVTVSLEEVVSGVVISLVTAGAVDGAAVSSTDGAAVANVTAHLASDALTYHDDLPAEDGTFSVPDIAPGTYELTLSAPGFADSTITGVIVASGQIESYDIVLDPTGKIVGRVTSSFSGTAVSRVKVQAWHDGVYIGSAITEADGSYGIEFLSPGAYRVMVWGTGGTGSAGAEILVTPGEQVTADLSVPVVGSISGNVFQSDGSTPMADVGVYLLHDSSIITHARTDSGGYYAFYITTPGVFAIVAAGSDTSFPAIAGVSVSAGDGISGLDFVGGNEVISAIVVSVATGDPIPDASVFVEMVGNAGNDFQVGYLSTDELGAFEYPYAIPGQYRLTAVTEGFASESAEVTVSEGVPLEAQIVMETAARISGIVSDGGTGDVLGGTVVYVNADASEGEWVAITDMSGHWAVDTLPPGTYDLFFLCNGYRRAVAQNVVVQPGETVQDASLDPADTRLSGVVVDADDNPIAGAFLTVSDAQGDPAGNAISAQSGAYELNQLTDGTYDILVEIEGYLPTEFSGITIQDGETLGVADLVVVSYAIPDPPPTQGSLNERIRRALDFVKGLPPLPGSLELPHPSNPNCTYVIINGEMKLLRYGYLKRLRRDIVSVEGDADVVLSEINMLANNLRLELENHKFNAKLELTAGLAVLVPLDINGYIAADSPREYIKTAAIDFSLLPFKLVGYVITLGVNLDSWADRVVPKIEAHLSTIAYHADRLLELKGQYEGMIGQLAGDLYDYVEGLKEYERLNQLCEDEEPEPKSKKQDEKGTDVETSRTPEDKFGPAGYDAVGTLVGSEQRFILPGQPFDYRVDFWNKPDAEVPTQDAIIIDRLDPAVFDVSTLDVTRVGFLNWDLEVSSGQVVDTRIDLMPEMNIAVEIRAGLGMQIPGFANNADIDENTLVFWFHTIDPETGEYPDDPMAGFLPPYNPDTGFEIGWIEYTVDPVDGLASGTQLANVAYVEFDFAGDIYDHPAPKVDPDVEPAVAAPWINTIDRAGPTSQVASLPATTNNEVVTIHWSGQDDNDGSGIASYDIYVATDNEPFELWLNDTTDTEVLFKGSKGHSYAFYSVARDNVGHEEPPPLMADTGIEVNAPPEIDDQTLSIDENSPNETIVGTVYATDLNAGDTLTYSILSGNDTGAIALDSETGEITVADRSQFDHETRLRFSFSIAVTDKSGLSDNATVTIDVNDINEPPVLTTIGNKSVDEGSLLTFTASASDPDMPANTLTFSLVAGAPAGTSIDPGSGVFTWAPTESQGPGTFNVTVRVTDDGTPNLDDFETIEVTVGEVNEPPVLASIGNKSVDEGCLLTFAPSATDPDTPANTLTFILDAGAPAGASINLTTGVFSWTPTEAQGPGIFNVTVRVTDDGTPNLDDFETIEVMVGEVNEAPVLATIGNKSVNEGGLLTFAVSASDLDTPANTLTFSLDAGAPAGASIDPNSGVFTWTPSEAQGPGTLDVTVRVTDGGAPNLDDFETISIVVAEVNDAPVLTAIGNQSVDEGNQLTFTASASDPDVPTNTLTFSLDSGAPSGASIDANSGVFTWTPSEAQGPGTFDVTVRVTDNGAPNLNDFETIEVTINEVNDFAPQIVDNTFNLDENSQTATVVGQVGASDQDAPSDLTFEIVTAAPSNPFAINAATGIISVINPTLLDRENTAAFTVQVRVTDNGVPAKSGTGTITVQLNDLNESAPHAADDGYETDEDTVLVIDPLSLLENDSRGDSTETLTVTMFEGVSQLGAAVTIDSVGGFRYDPRIPALQGIGRGETFIDTFTYQLEDGQGSTATALVTITVQGVNDWHNPTIPLDVNHNGSIEPLDGLIIINYLNSKGPGPLPGGVDAPEFYVDTDDDGFVAPLDVLLIFNKLNNPFGSGEGAKSVTGIAISQRIGFVQPHSAQTEAINNIRVPADLPRASEPVWLSSPGYFRQTEAVSGQEWRAASLLDVVFADEESLLDALDDLILSELAEMRG